MVVLSNNSSLQVFLLSYGNHPIFLADHIREEGLFRRSGNATDLKLIKDCYNTGQIVDFNEYNSHTVGKFTLVGCSLYIVQYIICTLYSIHHEHCTVYTMYIVHSIRV